MPVIGARDRAREMRDDKPHPADAAAHRNLSGGDGGGEKEHSPSKPPHLNDERSRIAVVKRKKIDAPAKPYENEGGGENESG